MRQYDLEQQLHSFGVTQDNIRHINGKWPVTIALLAVNAGASDRLRRDYFDMFLPTRPLLLTELTGGLPQRDFQYRTGIVGFTPPGASWAASWDSRMEGVAYFILPSIMEMAANLAFGEAGMHLNWRMALGDHAPAIAYLGLDIASQVATGFPAGTQHVDTQLDSLLAMIVRRYSATVTRDTSLVGVLSPQVLRAIRYIDSNLGTAFALQDICDIAGASQAHLNRLFRSELGDSVWGHVQARRIDEASNALRYSNATISRIAQNYGYPSPVHFARIFKSRFGKSPAEYRRDCQ